MRTIALTVIALAWTGLSFPEAHPFSSTAHANHSAASAEQASNAVIPMNLERGVPFVNVSVNGQGPFSFGVDTGTGADALVCPGFLQKLALPSDGTVEVGDPSGRARRTVPQYLISSLQIGGIEFKNVKAAQHEPFPGEEACNGTLGFPLFRDYLLTLDYRRKQLAISAGTLNTVRGENIVPFRLENGIPQITIKIGNREIGAHIDSRGSHGLSLPENFARPLDFTSSPTVIGRGVIPSGEFEIRGARLATDVEIAGFVLHQPFVEINSIFPVANIGALPLGHFAITFDQREKLVKFESSEKTFTIDPPNRAAAP